MSGRGRPRKAKEETPAAKSTESVRRRRSVVKPEEQSKKGLQVDTAVEEKKKVESKTRGAAVPRSAPAPVPCKPPCTEKKVANEAPKRADAPRSSSKRGTSIRNNPPNIQPEKELPCTAAKSAEEKKSTIRSPPSRRISTEDTPDRVLQRTLDKLKIKKSQRSEATRCVNEIQEVIIKHLAGRLDWCKGIHVLRTGSHYENVKICDSDEFDVMLAVSVNRVDIQRFGDDGAFYSVAMKRHPQKQPLDRFLNEDKTIRASEMLQEFREKVKEAVPKIPYDVTVEKKKQGCPAVTLQVKRKDAQVISLDFVLGLEVHSTDWPAFTADGFKVDRWLGKKVKMEMKRKPYYLVSKFEGRGMREVDGVIAKDAWRISFSHVEKSIIKNHGHSKTCCEKRTTCCRKQCLKLLKYLVQKLKDQYPKEAGKLCSYHAKTSLLHACAERVEDSEWAADNLSHCFQQLLHDFEVHLRKCQLNNFFIPSHNLLKSSGLDKKSCDFLANCIEYQRNNGFPLFADSL